MVKKYGLYFAWVISCIATIASLYISEILKIEPKTLCWLQRVCLFPLIITLAIAAYRADRSITIYTLPQSSLGALLAIYQILAHYGPVQYQGVCTLGSNTLGLGPTTIPILSLTTFSLINLCLIVFYRKN